MRIPVLGQILLLVLSAPGFLAAAERSQRRDVSLRITRGVTYAVRDERALRADVYMPKQGERAFPAVLMVHGGAWMSGSRAYVVGHARYAASRGYVVVAIDYRLAPIHRFPAQVEDCREAIRWICRNAERYQVDVQRIAAYGYSAGGHLACMLAVADDPDATDPRLDFRPRAVVAGGTPCDFRKIPENSKVLAYWLGGSRKENSAIYRIASPAAFVSPDDPPVFFFHGEQDRLVPPASPRGMLGLLEQAGVRSQLHLVSGAGHMATFLDGGSRRLAIDFLDEVLQSDGG